MLTRAAGAQPAALQILDVPFISQSEALCGGAAAAMVLRYWGERGIDAEAFAHLVDRSAAGISTTALVADLERRGWMAAPVTGTVELMANELARGRPVLTLIEDRPGTYHYIVIVAMTPGAVIFHDPARAPLRVMPVDAFARRWDVARRWMAVVVPRDSAPEAKPNAVATGAGGPFSSAPSCETRLTQAAALAQANDLDRAERLLVDGLSCRGAYRELAGVRLLQRRWPDVSELASAATTQDPADAHAWRLLATSRFLQDDAEGALDAWNRVGEPRVDLVVVRGLERTRQRAVERLVGVRTGDVLTERVLTRAERRLSELPAASSSRVEYAPVSGGLSELRAVVVERPLVPRGLWNYAAIGLVSAARREVELSAGAISGGGERITGAWRFWPGRPRVAGAFRAPAPWGGVVGVDAFRETQPFDGEIETAERTAAVFSWSNWVSAPLRLGVRAGVERRAAGTTMTSTGVDLRLLSSDERLEARADAGGWVGGGRFGTASVSIALRSSARPARFASTVRGGIATATPATPPDLWFAGDTGDVRPMLLRAHPATDDGALRVDRLGRRIAWASAEGQHWWQAPAAVRAGAAVFVDTARVARRLSDGDTAGDVDVGAGARLTVPGVRGTFRLDVARGLRDGATTLSFVFEATR